MPRYKSINLDGLLGMTEMEVAVATMLAVAERDGVSFEWVAVRLDDFMSDGMAKLGFQHLLADGYLYAGWDGRRSYWHPNEELCKILSTRIPVPLPKPPTLLERWEKFDKRPGPFLTPEPH